MFQKSRSLITTFIFASMLLAQLALANHATEHVSETYKSEINVANHHDDTHHHPEEHKDRQDHASKCTICSLQNNFTNNIISVALNIFIPALTAERIFTSSTSYISTEKLYAHGARAPPAFLI